MEEMHRVRFGEGRVYSFTAPTTSLGAPSQHPDVFANPEAH